MLRSLDLFTGYGGLTLALRDYCMPIAYVEIEDYCQKIIAHRMADRSLPRAPIFADVKNVRGSIGLCDIIIGGFPCQDISVAGNGKGLVGERSWLFREIMRLAEEIKPRFIFLENVPAIRTRGLDIVAEWVSSAGYDCRWDFVSAKEVGACHERKRWFMLAHANGEPLRKQSRRISRQLRKDAVLNRRNGKKRNDPDANSKGLERQHWEKQKLPIPSGYGRWSAEPSLCGRDHGFTHRMDRVKALGNGVVPIQARVAFERLLRGGNG